MASAVSPEWVQETGGAWLRASSERRDKRDRRVITMRPSPSGAYVSESGNDISGKFEEQGIETFDTFLVDLPTTRPLQLSMTTMRGR